MASLRTTEVRSDNYIALIGDMVRSRDFVGETRSRMQHQFSLLIEELNQRFETSLRSQFTITLGDEFQGLLKDPSVIPDVIWAIHQVRNLPQFRLGIGFGRIDTEIPPKAINLDGPAFHYARAAIQQAKTDGIMGGVFKGFDDQIDTIANGIARLLEFHLKRRSEKQLQVIDHLKRWTSQIEVAKQMGLTPQAVNDHKKAAGWEAYRAGEEALRQVLFLGSLETER